MKPVYRYISSRKGQCQFLSLWYSEIFSDYYQNLWNYNHCWLWLYKPKVFCYVQFSCVIQIRFLNHAFMKLTCSLKEKALACIHRRKELSIAFIHQKHYKPRQFEKFLDCIISKQYHLWIFCSWAVKRISFQNPVMYDSFTLYLDVNNLYMNWNTSYHKDLVHICFCKLFIV